jgi:hypothetical protein
MIWCPYCKRAAAVKRFYDDRCPQCRKIVGMDDVLTSNPYHPVQKTREQGEEKKFKFDQKGGSSTDDIEGSGALKSHPVSQLFGIQGRI